MSPSAPPPVAGLDLSLSATGLALPSGEALSLRPPRSLGSQVIERAVWIREQLRGFFGPGASFSGSRLCIEAPFVNPKMAGTAQALAILHGCVRSALRDWKREVAIVSPSSLKLYATGRGNARKAEVFAEAIRRLGYSGSSDDEADALWLRALALDELGFAVVAVPKKNKTALVKVVWSER